MVKFYSIKIFYFFCTIYICLLSSTFSLNVIKSQIHNYQIDNNAPVLIINENNLMITNITGSGLNQEMINRFKEIIQKAYSLYGQDEKQNTQYISTQLQNFYSLYFSVIIHKTNQNGIASYHLWSFNYTFVQWTKVNLRQPEWVYVIYGLQGGGIADYTGIIQTGSGIDQNKETVIRNTIISIENKYSNCYCWDLDIIGKKLQYFDDNVWIVICKQRGSTYIKGHVWNNEHSYMNTYPGNKCEYLVVAL